MDISSLAKLFVLAAALILLAASIVAIRRQLFSVRQVLTALLVAVAGTLVGNLLGVVPMQGQWNYYVEMITNGGYNVGDVISNLSRSVYYSLALAGILTVATWSLLLYLVQRYLPAPAAAAAIPSTSITTGGTTAAAAAVPSTVVMPGSLSAAAAAEPGVQPARDVPQKAALSQGAAMPFVIVAAGLSLGYLATLLLTQLAVSYAAYPVGWLLSGFITGALLFRRKTSGRWLAAAALAAVWALPGVFFTGLILVFSSLGIDISSAAFSRLYVFGTFAAVGVGSSLAILLSMRAEPVKDRG